MNNIQLSDNELKQKVLIQESFVLISNQTKQKIKDHIQINNNIVAFIKEFYEISIEYNSYQFLFFNSTVLSFIKDFYYPLLAKNNVSFDLCFFNKEMEKIYESLKEKLFENYQRIKEEDFYKNFSLEKKEFVEDTIIDIYENRYLPLVVEDFS